MTGKRSKTFLADWLRARMPTREEMESNKYLAPIAHRFLSPELWRFTRRSVPRGVALGMFAGFIVPIGQIFLAAFLALPARANVPVAALVTFVTNPLTLPFWLWVANRTGRLVLHLDEAVGGFARDQMLHQGGVASFWFEAAGVTAFGFVILAMVSAALGYLVSSFAWRIIIGRRYRTTRRRIRARIEAERQGTA